MNWTFWITRSLSVIIQPHRHQVSDCNSGPLRLLIWFGLIKTSNSFHYLPYPSIIVSLYLLSCLLILWSSRMRIRTLSNSISQWLYFGYQHFFSPFPLLIFPLFMTIKSSALFLSLFFEWICLPSWLFNPLSHTPEPPEVVFLGSVNVKVSFYFLFYFIFFFLPSTLTPHSNSTCHFHRHNHDDNDNEKKITTITFLFGNVHSSLSPSHSPASSNLPAAVANGKAWSPLCTNGFYDLLPPPFRLTSLPTYNLVLDTPHTISRKGVAL